LPLTFSMDGHRCRAEVLSGLITSRRFRPGANVGPLLPDGG
jgi:hypothetical protein